MARLLDVSGKNSLNLSFHQRRKVIKSYDDEINNWIPIDFEIRVYDKSYKIYPEVAPSLNMYEINLMLSKLRVIIENIHSKKDFEKVAISTYEFYYELEFFHLKEDELIECTIWTFETSRTNGEIQNVQRGFRFSVSVESLTEFRGTLELELNQIVN
ncbi:hypothetical protein [Paenibacillus xylanexedens]|uniref:WapI family immunity protein n=1 Tax=Paenibacillus xylanexedens TaxID=528191 RepID=UPI00119F1BA1|nr:hypothetical protein [Paenibacillus xylanexedens]